MLAVRETYYLESVMLYKDLKTISKTILTPAPTAIIASREVKLADSVDVINPTISVIDIIIIYMDLLGGVPTLGWLMKNRKDISRVGATPNKRGGFVRLGLLDHGSQNFGKVLDQHRNR